MGITYTDILSLHFGNSEFTTDDVRIILRTDRSAKLLSDLKFKGVLERTGKGRYRILAPFERIDNRSFEWKRVERIVNMSPFSFAWSGPSAVERWTNGGYLVAPNPYFRTFHIDVNTKDLEGWKEYLRAHSVPFVGKRRIGALVKLNPKSDLKYVILNDEKVLPKDYTIKMIKEHPGTFAKADELIEY